LALPTSHVAAYATRWSAICWIIKTGIEVGDIGAYVVLIRAPVADFQEGFWCTVIFLIVSGNIVVILGYHCACTSGIDSSPTHSQQVSPAVATSTRTMTSSSSGTSCSILGFFAFFALQTFVQHAQALALLWRHVTSVVQTITNVARGVAKARVDPRIVRLGLDNEAPLAHDAAPRSADSTNPIFVAHAEWVEKQHAPVAARCPRISR
jgi:hypothetical protein